MKKIILVVWVFSLSGCSISMPELFSDTYKQDINQGSVLDKTKVKQLEIGMNKTQVQELIGSPSIIDPFHQNQWDYINHSTLHKKNNIRYRLTLKFKDDNLISIISNE